MLGVHEELSLQDLSFPGEAACSWSMLVGHITCSGFVASVASRVSQSKDFHKSMSKAGAQTCWKSMCIQVRGCDLSQAIALLIRNGMEHICELLGLLSLAMGGFASRFYLSVDFF